MRHPFWILNISLVILLFVSAGFIFFTQQTLPKKLGLGKKNPSPKTASVFAENSNPVAINKIYENDLFDTYREKITPPVEPTYVSPIPVPPSQTDVEIPEEAVTPFLPALQITLKGIMILNDESKNVVVLEDNTTKKEKNYKVGDSIEDAQLVRILYNRIILVRSNGQFETLYLSEKDVTNQLVENDKKDGWAQTVHKVGENAFEVDPVSFSEIFPTLAECIDAFDITTIYKKGRSIGCRVGKITQGSLPEVFGFEPNDSILSIAGLDTSTAESRAAIYQHLTHLKLSDCFTVNCERDGVSFSFSVLLKDLKDPLLLSSKELQEKEKAVGILTGPSVEELEQERIQLLKDRYTFAQTAQDILIEQKEQMLTESKKGTLKHHSLSKES